MTQIDKPTANHMRMKLSESLQLLLDGKPVAAYERVKWVHETLSEEMEDGQNE